MAASFSPRRSTHEVFCLLLFAEDEDAFLAGEAYFLNLSIFSEQHGVIVGFCLALFPAAFAFGHNGFDFLYGGFVAVDQQAILTGLQVGLADFGALRNVDQFADGLGEYRNGECRDCQQRETSQERIGFHAGQLPFAWIESAEQATPGADGVDTQARERVDFTQRHLLFLD